MKARIITLIIAAFVGIGTLGAQNKWALKTNLLHDASASVNLALEYGFSRHWSAELSGSVNMWDLPDQLRLKHLIAQPELRYWFCERFSGMFLDAHLTGGFLPGVGGLWDFSQYYEKFPNLKTFLLKDALLLGAGVGFGYDFVLGRHWNLELEAGLGYMYMRGNEFWNDVLILEGSEFDYIGPTRLGITISYIF